MGDQQLPGMPPPWPLTVTRTDDGRAVAVHAGPMLLSAFGAADLEMRDLVICSLTEGSRFQGKTVAAAFGLQPSQVSRIRSRYRAHGARGLVHQMGRPPILSTARLRQARLQAGQGLTHAEIGRKLGVSRSRITELIKQHGTLPAPGSLFGDTGEDTGARDTGEPARPPATARTPPTDSTPAPPAATVTVPAMAPHPDSRPAGMPAPGRKPAEAAMAGGPPPRPLRPTPTTGTPRVRARPGGWRRGSRPGLSPAAMPGRCWCTPSPTGPAPGPC